MMITNSIIPLRRVIALMFILLFWLPLCSLAAKDFGLLLDNNASYEDIGGLTEPKYTGTLAPWFSTPVGDNKDLYLSAGVTVQYEYREWKFVPELLRTDFTWRIAENGELKIGRMSYEDPLGFIAKGLFDGLRYSMDLANGSILGIGAWYTGFLYKKTAYITMTGEDLARYETPFEYDNFLDSYFAPRRLVAAVDWEHPGIKELIRLRLALIGQFELSGNEDLYHSQYLMAKAGIPIQSFLFELGAAAELAENAGQLQVSFAGELGIAWSLPTPINDQLSFLARFSSGTFNDTIRAFVPITTEEQGSIIKEKILGLSILKLDYTARLFQSLSIGLESTYFILSDLGTFQNQSWEGYFYGNEFYGRVIWSPVSDIRITGGGGIFLPSLGNAAKEEKAQWRIDLGVMLALF